MKAQDVATALHRLNNQQGVGSHRRNGSWRWQDGSKVILKDRGMLVDLVLLTTDAGVSRTEITVWVVLWEI
jgi:hypothetical protein